MHVISLVSLVGVAIGTCALILVMSVFNGFEELILKMYNSFDPHLKIISAEGKVFNPNSIKINNTNILEKAYILEEEALLKYQDKEFIAKVKGVSNSYEQLLNFDSLLVDGNYINSYESKNVARIAALPIISPLSLSCNAPATISSIFSKIDYIFFCNLFQLCKIWIIFIYI